MPATSSNPALPTLADAVAAAPPDVRAVLADVHEVERHGGRRDWIGLEYIDDEGFRADLPYQPRTPRRRCDPHGQEQCSQCGTVAWLEASRIMPHVSPVEVIVLADMFPPAAPSIALVEAVLDGLPDADVSLAWMIAAGLTGVDAAALLGIREAAAWQRWSRLRKKLRARLACQGLGHSSRGVYTLPAAA